MTYNQPPNGPQNWQEDPNQQWQQNPQQWQQNPHQPQQWQQQPKKKPFYKRAGCLVGIAILVVILVVIGGCMALVGGVANEVDKSSKVEHTIIYKMEGDAQDAIVTFTGAGGGMAQENGVAAPWEKEATLTGFDFATFTATNGIYDEGQITCKIEADGNVLVENTSSGAGASASCNLSTTDIPQ